MLRSRLLGILIRIIATTIIYFLYSLWYGHHNPIIFKSVFTCKFSHLVIILLMAATLIIYILCPIISEGTRV